MSEFDSIMAERSDFELYKIIYIDSASYQAEAISSAQETFKSRAITPNIILGFEEQIQTLNRVEEQKKQEKTALKKKAFSIGKLLVPTEKDDVYTTVKSLCIFLSLSYLYHLIQNFEMIRLWFLDYKHWDLSMVEYMSPYILYPIGIYNLWKHKKRGWYVITGLLTYDVISTVFYSISTYYYFADNSYGLFGIMDELMPIPDIKSTLLRVIVLGGIVVFLNKKALLDLYGINKKNGLIFIACIALISTLLWLYLI